MRGFLNTYPEPAGPGLFADLASDCATYRAAKNRLPKRIIWELFPVFPGTSTERAILDRWGPLHLVVCLGKHRRALTLHFNDNVLITYPGGYYALQVLWVGQSEEIQRGDGHPFPRTEKY
jgi:hypothetical protein